MIIYFIRLFFLSFWVLVGFLFLLGASIVNSTYLRNQVIRFWSRILLKLVAVRTKYFGLENIPKSPFLLVSNHISWIDIFVILAHHPVSFIAKEDISGWPILGSLVRLSGTLFIDRKSKKTLKVVFQKIARNSDNSKKKSYAFFPEGKTSVGDTIMPFYSGLFSLAVEKPRYQILPVVIQYREDGDYSHACAYVDDVSFFQSLKQVFETNNLEARVTILPPERLGLVSGDSPSTLRKIIARDIRIKMLGILSQ